jgi:iron(III) transport system permease protein
MADRRMGQPITVHAGSTAKGRGGRIRTEHVLVVGVAILLAYLALVPLGYLAWRTFVVDGSFTLDNVREAYGAFGLGELALNSLWFAAGTTAIGVSLGTALAYLVVRTNLPGRTLVVACTLLQLLVPGVLYTISWIFLASPRTGLYNRLLEPLFGPGTLDVFGLGGMVVVEGLHLVPVVFLLMAAAFSAMDPALEESAFASGARLPSVIRRVTLPLVRPALLAAVLLVAVRALEAFEVPALLGIPGGVWVFTSRIWHALNGYPADLGQAGAYALSLLAVTAVGVFLLSRLASRRRRFQTITGKGRARPARVDLGSWRWPVACLTWAYLAIAALFPLLILLYASTQPYYAPPTLDSLSRMSLDNYADVLGQEATARSVWNTALLAAGSSTAVLALAAVAAWLVVRTRVRGRWALDALAFVPIAIPGLVLGVSLLVVYLRVPIPVYGTLWILLIAYVTVEMPYGIRFASAPMHQVGDELEESAHTSGAGWWQTFRRVILPLLLPALLAGWIYVFVASARELSTSLLLYSPGNEVVSIRIWELYQQGSLTQLAALGVMMVGVLVVLIGVAFRIGGTLGLRQL